MTDAYRKSLNLTFHFRHKKANIFMDSMLVLFILLGVGIVTILGYKVFTDVNAELQADDSLSTEAKALSQNTLTKYPSYMDAAFLFLLVLLWIFVLVSSAMIDSHPMFFIVSLLLLIFVLVVVMLLANSFDDIMEDEEFSSSAAEFPIINYIMGHLLTVFIVIGGSILLVLFAKNQYLGG